MGLALSHVGLTHANGKRALQGIGLAAGRGERIAIIGPSGAGKTTLIRILAASLRPTEGTVAILDQHPWQLGRAQLRRLRSRIGMVHQKPPIPPRQRAVTAVLAGRLGQWPWWKSALSLLYPLDIAGARAQLARLELADRLFERCDRLSGGELQRVGVARVLYQSPQLLLADEPVSAMDPALADLTINQLHAEASSRGITLVASLHAVDLALRWFPRVIGLKAGSIVFDLPPVRISDGMLRELYVSESGYLPTQDNRPLDLEPRPGRAARRIVPPRVG
jgi:phosphonate transport system ATP-binding protein